MWQDIEDLDSEQGPWSSPEIHKCSVSWGLCYCLMPESWTSVDQQWHTTIAVHRPHQDNKELSTGVLESKYEGCETDKSKNYPWPMLSHSVHGPRRHPGHESLSRHGLVSARADWHIWNSSASFRISCNVQQVMQRNQRRYLKAFSRRKQLRRQDCQRQKERDNWGWS